MHCLHSSATSSSLLLRACLHGGGGLQEGVVTCLGGVTNLLRKKSHILQEFQGQIRGKIGQFRRIFAGNFGANFAEKQSAKKEPISLECFGQISLKFNKIFWVDLTSVNVNAFLNRDNHLLFQNQYT